MAIDFEGQNGYTFVLFDALKPEGFPGAFPRSRANAKWSHCLLFSSGIRRKRHCSPRGRLKSLDFHSRGYGSLQSFLGLPLLA